MSQCGPNCECPEAKKARAVKDIIIADDLPDAPAGEPLKTTGKFTMRVQRKVRGESMTEMMKRLQGEKR